jgi:hypothetical protein
MPQYYAMPLGKANRIAAMQLTTFPSKTACFADTLDKMNPFVDISKVPSPIHADFRGMQQGKLSTK